MFCTYEGPPPPHKSPFSRAALLKMMSCPDTILPSSSGRRCIYTIDPFGGSLGKDKYFFRLSVFSGSRETKYYMLSIELRSYVYPKYIYQSLLL